MYNVHGSNFTYRSLCSVARTLAKTRLYQDHVQDFINSKQFNSCAINYYVFSWSKVAFLNLNFKFIFSKLIKMQKDVFSVRRRMIEWINVILHQVSHEQRKISITCFYLLNKNNLVTHSNESKIETEKVGKENSSCRLRC